MCVTRTHAEDAGSDSRDDCAENPSRTRKCSRSRLEKQRPSPSFLAYHRKSGTRQRHSGGSECQVGRWRSRAYGRPLRKRRPFRRQQIPQYCSFVIIAENKIENNRAKDRHYARNHSTLRTICRRNSKICRRPTSIIRNFLDLYL